MQPPPPEAAKPDPAALAYLCANLQEICDALGDDGSDPTTPVAKTLAAVAADDAPATIAALNTLHAALQHIGDALGVYGSLRGLSPTGIRGLEVIYRCPLGRCTGRDRSQAVDDAPVCAISGKQLRREVLP